MPQSYGKGVRLSSPIIIALASPRPATSFGDGIARIERLAQDAAERGARIVCFPEAYLPGLRGQDFDVIHWDRSAQDQALAETARIARTHRIAIIMGIEQITAAGSQVAAAVFDASGTLTGVQTKTQLDPSEDRYYVPGITRRMFEIEGLKFGIAICHEGWRYPETVRWAATRGAKIVFHPQHTGADRKPSGDDAYYAKAMEMRARENGIWFASVNYALRYPDSVSSVYHPSGRLHASLPDGDSIVVTDIDPAEATAVYAGRYQADRYGDEAAMPPMQPLVAPHRFAVRTIAAIEIEKANAELAQGALSDEAWAERMSSIMAQAYLIDDDPRWQSGFDGDAALWRDARELVLDPVTRDGSFLDVGCANGHLMESVEAWGAERGITLDVFGLELSPDLAAKARERLPSRAAKVFEGNAMTWKPPRRFTYVHTGLEYAPEHRRSELIRRLVTEAVEPGGLLITGPVNADERAAQLDHFAKAGVTARTAERIDRNGKTRFVVYGP